MKEKMVCFYSPLSINNTRGGIHLYSRERDREREKDVIDESHLGKCTKNEQGNKKDGSLIDREREKKEREGRGE